MDLPVSDFITEIERRLSSREGARANAGLALDAEMRLLAQTFADFDHWADAFHRSSVRPRLESLRQHIPGASIEHIRTARGFHSRCVFARSERIPAQVTLHLGVDLEPRRAMIVISYSLEIIPMLMEFERRHELELRLDARDDKTVVPWIERKLLHFLDVYLSIEDHPQYHRNSFTIDPVCGMRVSSVFTGEQARSGSRTYAFCSSRCRERFLESPERYLTEPFLPIADPGGPHVPPSTGVTAPGK